MENGTFLIGYYGSAPLPSFKAEKIFLVSQLRMLQTKQNIELWSL